MQLNTSQQQRVNQDNVVSYLQQLIRFRSITPEQGGAINWLQQQLQQRGFDCHVFTCHGVTNLVADCYFGPGAKFAFVAISMLYLLMHRGGMLIPLLLR